MKIGFIGLGNMGQGMADNLLDYESSINKEMKKFQP